MSKTCSVPAPGSEKVKINKKTEKLFIIRNSGIDKVKT
jgi:hypothetical protein